MDRVMANNENNERLMNFAVQTMQQNTNQMMQEMQQNTNQMMQEIRELMNRINNIQGGTEDVATFARPIISLQNNRSLLRNADYKGKCYTFLQY